MSRPFTPRHPSNSNSFVRINGKIRAREVRVIGDEGEQLGVLPLGEALQMAKARSVDLVEIAPNATPPVCRLVDFGKFRYEQAKKDKDSKKHQHANKVKEIQLSPNIDPHDFGVKLSHAIDFLCQDMKVKVSLRFRGREMAHQEFGFAKIHDFIKQSAPFGHPDAPPKLIGKGINLMLSPLPRAKRAKHPNEEALAASIAAEKEADEAAEKAAEKANKGGARKQKPPQDAGNVDVEGADKGLTQNPFSGIDLDAQRS
ncbi:MAG: translation initiation factor IF-3 [Verrucomicrobiales bacterium]